MGLRDRLKEAAKSVLGRNPAAPPDVKPPPAPPYPPNRHTPAAPPFQPAKQQQAAAPSPETILARSAELAEGAAITRARGGDVIAIFRREGKLFAIDNACVHEDGPIGEGAISGCKVQCPYHDWEYDFTTGACLTDPERAVGTWAVREENGAIWLGARLTEGSGARGGDHNDGLEVIKR